MLIYIRGLLVQPFPVQVVGLLKRKPVLMVINVYHQNGGGDSWSVAKCVSAYVSSAHLHFTQSCEAHASAMYLSNEGSHPIDWISEVQIS